LLILPSNISIEGYLFILHSQEKQKIKFYSLKFVIQMKKQIKNEDSLGFFFHQRHNQTTTKKKIRLFIGLEEINLFMQMTKPDIYPSR
jgi:hypothetical protein